MKTKPIHIAIVEDDADDLYFISSAFKETSKHLQISSFKSGGEFLKFIKAGKGLPNIVVTDIRMPLITGFDVIKKVKSTKKTEHIPIVVLSTSSEQDDKEQAAHLGASAYYVKPYTLPDYCDISHKILDNFSDSVQTKLSYAIDLLKEKLGKILAKPELLWARL